jgi:Tol biopolymer transport system component
MTRRRNDETISGPVIRLLVCRFKLWPDESRISCGLDTQKEDSRGLVAWLHSRLDPLVRTLVHHTSPDIPRESRRLWRISADGTGKCILSSDTGVQMPRWGASGKVLFFDEAGTNGDGRIDALDDYLIRIVPASGGATRTIGQGKSAVWSPDGKFVAYVHGGRLEFTGPDGAPVNEGAIHTGHIVMSNSPNREVARNFWAVDSQTGNQVPLPAELSSKYLWMGMLSPSGARIVYSNTTKTAIIISAANQTSGINLIADGALNLDHPGFRMKSMYLTSRHRNAELYVVRLESIGR